MSHEDGDVRLAVLEGVRGHEPNCPPELWREASTGRLILKLVYDAGYAETEVDILDVIQRLRDDKFID